MDVHLHRNNGRSWHARASAHAKGFAFLGDDLLKGEALARYLHGPVKEFSAKINRLSGEFAAVLVDPQLPSRGAAAVDRIRSIPLFYGHTGEQCYLSDDARWVACQASARPRHLDPLDTAEFMLRGMTPGSRTLVPGVYQLQAGEMLLVKGGKPFRRRYFQYGMYEDHSPPLRAQPGQRRALERKGVAVIEDAFERFLQSVGNRPLVVPLSGGLDSRLIATLLARAGRTDTLCFSYGHPNSFDARTSRRVADALGLRWAFVRYTNRRWHRWYGLDEYQRYRREASNLCAIEHEQDWPAVRHLQKRGELPNDAVFAPGHGGFLSSSHLPAAVFDASAPCSPIQWIWDKYFVYWPTSRLPASMVERLQNRIEAVTPDRTHSTSTDRVLAARSFEHFNWQERQAKMIVNSVRVYEHFDCDWRLPHVRIITKR
jgi:asparagine synthase (glutamine-hydrolysing)